MKSKPLTHEARLAQEIDRCRALANELGLLSTKHYLDIAAVQLSQELAEKTARVRASRKVSD